MLLCCSQSVFSFFLYFLYRAYVCVCIAHSTQEADARVKIIMVLRGIQLIGAFVIGFAVWTVVSVSVTAKVAGDGAITVLCAFATFGLTVVFGRVPQSQQHAQGHQHQRTRTHQIYVAGQLRTGTSAPSPGSPQTPLRTSLQVVGGIGAGAAQDQQQQQARVQMVSLGGLASGSDAHAHAHAPHAHAHAHTRETDSLTIAPQQHTQTAAPD